MPSNRSTKEVGSKLVVKQVFDHKNIQFYNYIDTI